MTQSEDPDGSNEFSVPANISDINQEGNNTNAVVTQSNNNAGGSSNTARIDQFASDRPDTSTVPSGFALEAIITQNGSGNQSSISQLGADGGTLQVDGSGLRATNTQDGLSNASTINQEGQLDANPVSEAVVTQLGDFNNSNVFQAGDGQSADVFQEGLNNISDVNQFLSLIHI